MFNVTAGSSISKSLIRTYLHDTQLPVTATAAIAQGWIPVDNCDANLGFLYTNQGDAPYEDHPLGLYFTATGKLAGAQVTIYRSNKEVGDAAAARKMARRRTSPYLLKIRFHKLKNETPNSGPPAKPEQRGQMQISSIPLRF
jgi:hypothetical protein